jgi:methionyl-tRNA formyltransferase
MQIGPDFLNDVLWMYAKNEVQAIPQKETVATYCKKIIKQD